MELRHLRYFVAVAEELHFGRAAARLHLAQPPLSQQIRQLEDELGFPLFLRAHRRVQLTAAGRAFLADARAVLARVAAGVASARRVARGETGALAVGFVASAGLGLVPAAFRRFRRRFPDVALTLTELSTAEQVAALREGSIQLGLARPPVDDPTVEAVPLAEEPLIAALPAGHPRAGARRLALRALAEEPFVLFPRQPRPGWADRVIAHCVAAGFRPAVVQEALEMSTALALVGAGVGVTLVPASVRALHLDGVVYRPLAPPAPATRLVALHRREDAPPAVARFLEVAREVLARDLGAARRTR